MSLKGWWRSAGVTWPTSALRYDGKKKGARKDDDDPFADLGEDVSQNNAQPEEPQEPQEAEHPAEAPKEEPKPDAPQEAPAEEPPRVRVH